MRRILFWAIGLAAVLVSVVLCRRDVGEASSPAHEGDGGASRSVRSPAGGARPVSAESGTVVRADSSAVGGANGVSAGASSERQPSDEMSPEEKAANEAEAQVEAFDVLTDKWMEPAKQGVAMKDVDAFVAQFKKVPKDRQEECLHRALNLVPDENVMLLAGILLDRSQPQEYVELVFNDVLNRDESVKQPILQQLYKDKAHPCWADVAWILDVTGELPKSAAK